MTDNAGRGVNLNNHLLSSDSSLPEKNGKFKSSNKSSLMRHKSVNTKNYESIGMHT